MAGRKAKLPLILKFTSKGNDWGWDTWFYAGKELDSDPPCFADNHFNIPEDVKTLWFVFHSRPGVHREKVKVEVFEDEYFNEDPPDYPVMMGEAKSVLQDEALDKKLNGLIPYNKLYLEVWYECE
jgi:hypothetical protein